MILLFISRKSRFRFFLYHFLCFSFRYLPCFSRDPNGTLEKENFSVVVFVMDDRLKFLLHFCCSPILCDFACVYRGRKGFFFLACVNTISHHIILQFNHPCHHCNSHRHHTLLSFLVFSFRQHPLLIKHPFLLHLFVMEKL